jgi:uncharacterized integral membrane protein
MMPDSKASMQNSDGALNRSSRGKLSQEVVRMVYRNTSGTRKVDMRFREWLHAVVKRLTSDGVLMVILLLLIVVGLGSVAKSLSGGTVTWLGMLWCLSCLTVGLLTGFLFAIPRVSNARRGDDKSNNTGQETREAAGLGINTNLEEISDWLTKILVGIGLVEAKTLKGYLGSVGRYVGQSLGPNGDVVAVGFVIFFLCIGFLSGFLATRLFISPSLRRADAETGGMNEAERVAREAKDQSDATPELYDVLDAAYATWMTFYNKRESKRKDPAEPAKKATASQPVLPPELAYSYLEEFKKFYVQPRWLLNRRLHMLMANFYADTAKFSDAIRVITRFIDEKRIARQFDIHLAAALYNRACYRARIASLTTDAVEKESEVAFLLNDLKEDVRICRSDAEEARQDEDFAEWQKDPRFLQIIQ